jgi:hypothetical protein
MPESSIELLKFYRGEIRFESEMIENRLSSLMSAQSFLVLGYATVMVGLVGGWRTTLTLALPPALALLGLILSLQAWLGIRTAYGILAQWLEREHHLLERDDSLREFRPPYFGEKGRGNTGAGRGETLKQATVFATVSPWIFAAWWCYFGVLPLVLYSRH